MNSKTSRNIVRDMASKYGLNIKDVFDICESQYSVLKDSMASCCTRPDGNDVYYKFPVVKLFGFGTFYPSLLKIKYMSMKNFKIAKEDINLINELDEKE